MLTLTRLILAVLTLVAIGQQLILHVAASYSVLNFFSYFTNLSNIFAALILLLSVFLNRSSSQELAKYASTVNMVVVGLVFAILLRNVDLGALLPWVNFVLHYLMPVAVVLNWLAAPPATKLRPKHMLITLVFPTAYLVYVLVRGASTGWYPYPFLNPANVGGYGAVAAYSLGITATFLIASWALLVIGNRLGSSKRHNASA
ncbi:Pr6Pr family membrane protein [Pseudomonas sp. LS44]|uniref:Pr6Pr family membrane protein n=1 Tax=Pseudomonas sp. LS44 TaxID=1357074 RepID=UPI00215B697C|nr:Pr6Pr family membrane protein [Pseudomonas sp. LS44]UVE16637.1 Pr6Pr family membrane protein [Pseudomonas sp. LS44]